MRYIFSCCLLLFFFAGKSQETEFNRLGIEDGLSQNSVLSITQDSLGFLWFGTRDGLNKYDSHRFTVYKHSPAKKGSISDNYITALLCDSKNTVWVGTHNGLNKYNAVSDDFSRIPLRTATSSEEVNRSVNCIYEDRKGRIWVGTDFTAKVLVRTGSRIIVNALPVLKRKLIIRSIYQDHESIFWIGTSSGIIRLKEDGNRFILLDTLQYKEGDKGSLSSNQVTSIVEDAEKNIWAGTLAGGLNLYNRRAGSFTHFVHNTYDKSGPASNNIRKLLTDTKNNLWIGTQDGLSVMDIGARNFRNHSNDPWDRFSLSQNSIHSLYKDKTGTIWIGTFFGGVNSVYSYKTPFRIFNNRSSGNRLNNNVVSSIVEDNHSNLWIGTEGGGVNYLDVSTGRSVYYMHNPDDPPSLGSNLVKTIYKDRDNNIWIGTHGGGLNLFNREKNTFTKFLYKDHETVGSEITCLLEDSRNIFWVGTETSGIKLFKKEGTNIKAVNLLPPGPLTQKASILSVLETTGKKIWLGTIGGLYIIDGNKLSVARQPDNTSPLNANCIFEDLNGNIWVGTRYSGLLKYDRTGKILKRYDESDGLPNNNVLGILQDDKDILWISTGNSLCRFNIDHETFIHYTEADGLAGNIYNHNSYYKNKNGKMFFGGYNGFVSFFPQNVEINHTPPPVYITSLDLNIHQKEEADKAEALRDIKSKKNITLRYNQNLFTIGFAALNYIKSSKNTYQYILKGYDAVWNTTNNPSAVYSNVPPGSYQFIVKGSNNDNVWSKPATLHITVLPPFWKTWWAYTLYILAISGFIFLIIRYFFLRELYKKNQELTQLKLNFFTNISHEIRTRLSLIIGPADKLITDNKQDRHDRQQLITIKNNSESLLQLVNELMDFRKAETGHLRLRVSRQNIVPFIQSIYSSFYNLSVSENIQTDFISTAENIVMYFDAEQLKKVFYNLLSNAFKFTPPNSYISVKIEEKDEYTDISVINNGRGISKENIGKLFDNYFQEDDHGKTNTGYGIGLALSKSIVEMHRGSLTVTSESKASTGNDTCFTVRLLKGKAHFSDDQITEEEIQPLPGINVVPEPAHQETQTARQSLSAKHTLLLVEDNNAIRTFIKEALIDRYKIIESENGLEGWKTATGQIPDLIISDVMMPEMDGLSLCKKIKSDERTSHIPLILLTAKNTITSQISGLQTGADVYLTKPFSLQILSLHIFNLLRAREVLWKQFDTRMKSTADAPVTGPPQLSLHPLDEAFISKMIQIVEDKLDDPQFGVAMLSQIAAMSQPVLFKKIKAITGLSANEFVKSLRLKKAAELLCENRYTVYEIAYIVGYDSSKYFSREFKKHYNKTPSEYAADKMADISMQPEKK